MNEIIPLERKEYEGLKSQIVTSSWGGRRKLPYAFTEHGAVMPASVQPWPRVLRIEEDFLKVLDSSSCIMYTLCDGGGSLQRITRGSAQQKL